MSTETVFAMPSDYFVGMQCHFCEGDGRQLAYDEDGYEEYVGPCGLCSGTGVAVPWADLLPYMQKAWIDELEARDA